MTVKYPSVPEDVRLALTVNVDNLRPWEWSNLDADWHGLMLDLRAAWNEGRAGARADATKDQKPEAQ